MSILLYLLSLIKDTAVIASEEPWRVNTGFCRIERTYRSGSRQVKLSFRPSPFSNTVIVTANFDQQTEGDAAFVAATATGPNGRTDFTSLPEIADRPVFRTKVTDYGYGLFSGALLKSLATAETVTLARRSGPLLAVRIDDVTTVQPQLAECLRARLATMGIDPAIRAQIAIEPKPIGDTGRWFDRTLYDGLRILGRVRVTMLATVSGEGRAPECRLIDPTTLPEAGPISCAVLIERDRFTPARDASNKPVTGYVIVPLVLMN